MAITPDAIMHLPRHFPICSWQALGARVPAFAMHTLPLIEDPARIAHHRARQRERGYFVPQTLPHPFEPVQGEGESGDPLADLEDAERRARREALADVQPEVIDRLMRANGDPEPRATDSDVTEGNRMRTSTTTATRRTTNRNGNPRPRPLEVEGRAVGANRHGRAASCGERDAGATVITPLAPPVNRVSPKASPAQGKRDARARPASLEATDQAQVPDSYLEVQIEPAALAWDDAPVDPIDQAPEPDERDLEILSALHRLGAAAGRC